MQFALISKLTPARRSDNPLFKMTEEGAVTKAMAVQYLANLHFMHASDA